MSNSESNQSLLFSVKVGKSYKNRGWALNRESAVSLVPKVSYEDECDILVDGIPAKARFNIVPRIFYNSNQNIVDHLKKLSDEGVERVDLELLLNHNDSIDSSEVTRLLEDINKLNHQLTHKDLEISELKDQVKYFKSFENNKDEELEKLHKEISDLKNIIINQDNEIDSLFNSIIQLELDNDESFKQRAYYEEENKKLNKKIEKLLDVLSAD